MRPDRTRDRMIAWIRQRGRVTVADLCARSGQSVRVAFRRLAEADMSAILSHAGQGKETGDA